MVLTHKILSRNVKRITYFVWGGVAGISKRIILGLWSSAENCTHLCYMEGTLSPDILKSCEPKTYVVLKTNVTAINKKIKDRKDKTAKREKERRKRSATKVRKEEGGSETENIGGEETCPDNIFHKILAYSFVLYKSK